MGEFLIFLGLVALLLCAVSPPTGLLVSAILMVFGGNLIFGGRYT